MRKSKATTMAALVGMAAGLFGTATSAGLSGASSRRPTGHRLSSQASEDAYVKHQAGLSDIIRHNAEVDKKNAAKRARNLARKMSRKATRKGA